ncbi:MAG: hypothetical protein ACI4TJ_04645 [Candidatus Cryptobacteroides sp.]
MKKFSFAAALVLGLVSCVNVDERLGADLIATNQKYDIFTAEIPIEDIRMFSVDSLVAFSSKRITFGSIRDDDFGLTRRGSVVTLVPVLDTFNFGNNPKFDRFIFRCGSDSISVSDKDQAQILQNVNVYELTEPVNSNKDFSQSEIKHGTKRITKGVPIVNGSDSLVFEFNEEYGKKFFNITQDDLDDLDTYTKKFPGIYLTTDDPAGNGGRFNMFDFDIMESNNGYMTRKDNYAVLYFNSEYDGVRKDSLLMFYFSPTKMQDLDSLMNNNILPSQYVFNVDYHEKSKEYEGAAKDRIFIEGGSGIKPMVPSEHIRTLVHKAIAERGGDPKTALITKATVELPFTFPEDYTTMFKYPMTLSPTIKISTDTTVTFAGLTDASISTENQGDINRSLCEYAPDITHHVQQIIRLDDDADFARYDVWFLIMWYATNTTYNADAGELADYYQQLAYYSYYNALYGGGYGGYGGYGSYSNMYSGYYSYLMMAQYASSAATTTTTSAEMDKDHYYCAALNGPESLERKPTLKVCFAIPKK